MNKATNIQITAAVIIIGDEILSGKIADANLIFLSQALTKLGIDLIKAQVIADNHIAIIHAVNHCRHRYTYVFTTGGIGPTHDDITSQAVAAAFEAKLVENKEAVSLIYNANPDSDVNNSVLKMAQLPIGAKLILNQISGAPGWQLENVYVLAGIPAVMQDMFSYLAPGLSKGTKTHSHGLIVYCGESVIASTLSDLQDCYSQIKIGSYPKRVDGRHFIELVFRCHNTHLSAQAIDELKKYLDKQQIKYN